MSSEYNTVKIIFSELGFNYYQHNIQLFRYGSLLFLDNGNLSEMLMGDSSPTSRY